MSSMLVCDVCGKVIIPPNIKLRAMRVDENSKANSLRVFDTFDVHDKCLENLKAWMQQQKAKEPVS
jgi:hypothetical protein